MAKQGYRRVEFDDVVFKGVCNDIVLFKARYKIGKKKVKDEIFVKNGEYWFRGKITNLYKYFCGSKISEDDYIYCYTRMIKETNQWCQQFGLPKLEIPTKRELLNT